MKAQEVNVAVANIHSVPALDEALKTALGGAYLSLSVVPGKVLLHLSDSATDTEANQAQQVVLNHDFNRRTAEQTAAVQRHTDFLDAIGTRADTALTAIESDLAILGGSPTNGQVVQVLTRTLNRQRTIIKAFQRLKDIVT